MTQFQELGNNVEKKVAENAQKEEDYEDAPDEFKGGLNGAFMFLLCCCLQLHTFSLTSPVTGLRTNQGRRQSYVGIQLKTRTIRRKLVNNRLDKTQYTSTYGKKAR